MVVVESEARAREVAEYRARKRREQRQASSSRQTLDQLLKTREAGEKRLLPLVLKTDVQGSAEAIQGALAKLGTDEVGVQILQAGVGGITESDVILAHASGAARDRLQCPRQQPGARPRQARRRGNPLLQHHLQSSWMT